MIKAILVLILVAATSAASQGAIINLQLSGAGGEGLLVSNTNGGASSGGSGGALLLDYNDASMVLSFDLRWGSGNGFTDLSSPITVAHIHGPTGADAPTSFGQNAGVAFNLITAPTSSFNSSTTSGGATGTWVVPAAQESNLLNGRFYVNIHTDNNPGGEIRGYIVVPEPTTAVLGLFGLLPFALRRRRK